MTKLEQTQNGFWVNRPRQFNPMRRPFKSETIKIVFDFAYGMTFGELGEHRDHRTGGLQNRKNGQIFADTFQGKLAECAVCNLFFGLFHIDISPDFEQYKLGEWDNYDVHVEGVRVNIKSTKTFGNLLLLEYADWDNNGVYLPNAEKGEGIYDFFFLIRIKPDCTGLLTNERLLYSDDIKRDKLLALVSSQKEWRYDYAGFVTHEELVRDVIRGQQIIRQGDILNGGTPMDADNYYVQAGDMHKASEFKAFFERNKSLKQ